MEFIIRLLLCLIFPPLAVFDKGCGAICMVGILTFLGWLPGTIMALILVLADKKKSGDRHEQ